MLKTARSYRILFTTVSLFLLVTLSSPFASAFETSTRDRINELYSSQLLLTSNLDPTVINTLEELISVPGNEIIELENISEVNENYIVFEHDQIISSSVRVSEFSEQHRKDILYVGTSRAYEGEISGSESDSRDAITIYSTIYYTTSEDDGIEYVSLDKATGKRLNLGEKVTILQDNVRLGQSGWAKGGYYTQFKDYEPGSSFIISPPSSWLPVQADTATVGVTYTMQIQYSDGSTEWVELSNNV